MTTDLAATPDTADGPRTETARATTPERSKIEIWRRAYRGRAITLDIVGSAAAALIAHLLRHGLSSDSLVLQTTRAPTWAVVVLSTMSWVIVVALTGGYGRQLLGAGSEEYRRVLLSGLRLFAFAAMAIYLTSLQFSRQYVVVFLLVATTCSLAARFGLRRLLHRQRARGLAMSRVIAVGRRPAVEDFAYHFASRPYLGYEVVGACLLDEEAPSPITLSATDTRPTRDVPVEPGLGSVERMAPPLDAHTVVIAGTGVLSPGALEDLAQRLEDTQLDLVVAPGMADVAGPRIQTYPLGGVPLLHVEKPKLQGVGRAFKTGLERVGALIGLLVLSPILLLLGTLVRLTSKGPALFGQMRVGRDGRLFTMWKFRTMSVTAETELAELAPHNETDGPHFKIRNDPRLTATGRRLRRWSLDELPQLWSVLKGDMSLVGPRPPLPDEVARYDERARRRLRVRPGITGLWQVSGRADLSWEESVGLDLYYIDNWSLSLDVVIMLRTAFAVVRGKGAY